MSNKRTNIQEQIYLNLREASSHKYSNEQLGSIDQNILDLKRNQLLMYSDKIYYNLLNIINNSSNNALEAKDVRDLMENILEQLSNKVQELGGGLL